MTEADRPGFLQVMVALGETYDTKITDSRLEIYFRALEDLPLATIRDAARAHVQSGRFFPKPVELREAAGGSVDDRGEIAWGEVLTQIRRVGYLGTPKFNDPAIARAVYDVFGGWKRLCETLPSEGPGLLGMAKQFKATYGALARQDARLLALPASRDDGRTDAKALLGNLKRELDARSLPAHGLD